MYPYKISVIIPVYNSQNTLVRTLESILLQLNKDIEIILVDDGSTDNSPKLCDKYAEENQCVSVIHKVNGGISSARNAGINMALGEYITFIDSDDYYSQGLFPAVLDVIQSEKPDCIYFGWQYVYQEEVQQGRLPDLPKKVLLDRHYIHNEIIPPMINLQYVPEKFIDDFSYNKFYKHDIIQSCSIQFMETRRIWEDRPFVVEYLYNCNSFYCMDGIWYNYVQMTGSLSGRYYLNFFDIILENYHLYKKLFGEEYDFEIPYVNNYWKNSIQSMIFRSLNQTKDQEQIELNIISTFNNPLVRKWFLDSSVNNIFDRLVKFLFKKEKYNQLLTIYKVKAETDKHIRKIWLINYTKRVINWLKRSIR